MRRLVSILCLLASSSLLYAEVYKWVDADGKTHFGDRQPVGSNSQKLDLPESPKGTTDAAPTDDYRVRQQKLLNALSEERALKQQHAEKQAEAQAKAQRTCQQAKDYLTNISSGKIYHLNDKGERVYANDAEQSTEINQTKTFIRQHCQ